MGGGDANPSWNVAEGGIKTIHETKLGILLNDMIQDKQILHGVFHNPIAFELLLVEHFV